MKPIGSLLAAGALAVCSSGCATISTTKDGRLDGIVVKGVRGAVSEHVCLTTTGEYFLWAIPVGSGKFVWNDQTNTKWGTVPGILGIWNWELGIAGRYKNGDRPQKSSEECPCLFYFATNSV